MKTTQLTSKVLVAALLLSVVSPVLAVPNFVSTNWAKAKNLASDIFMPSHPSETDKKSARLSKGIATEAEITEVKEEIAKLKQNLGEVSENAVQVRERIQASIDEREAELKNLTKEKSFLKRQVVDRANMLRINHPNYVKYGAMSAVAAALVAGSVAVANHYGWLDTAKAKIKSLFGFGKQPVLNQIVTKADEMIKAEGQQVEQDLAALVKSEEVTKAIDSCKETKKALIDAVNTFNAKLGAYNSAKDEVSKKALTLAKEALVKAVEACNAELQKQEKAGKADTASSNTESTTTTEPKTTPATPAPKAKATAAGMGAPRTVRR